MIKNNKFSIAIALIIMILSLAGAENFHKIPAFHFRGIDKVVHAGMYFLFMSVILLENRKRIEKKYSPFLIAIIPSVFGLVMELLQLWLTSTRSGDIFDFLFNLAGIVFALIIFFILRTLGKTVFR